MKEENRLKIRINELQMQDPFNDPERLNDNDLSGTDASEESDHDRIFALINESQENLKAVQSALKKIDDGTYGICLKCGEAIEVKRLEIFPSAQYCIKCGHS